MRYDLLFGGNSSRPSGGLKIGGSGKGEKISERVFVNVVGNWYSTMNNRSLSENKQHAKRTWDHLQRLATRSSVEIVPDRPQNAMSQANQTSPAGFSVYPERKSLFARDRNGAVTGSKAPRAHYAVPQTSLYEALLNRKKKR